MFAKVVKHIKLVPYYGLKLQALSVPVHLLLEQILIAGPRLVAVPPPWQCLMVRLQYGLVVVVQGSAEPLRHLALQVLRLFAAVAAVIAVAPSLTKRVVLLHRRPADISDCFQFSVNIVVVVPAALYQPCFALCIAAVVASFAAVIIVGYFLLLFASFVVAVVPSSFAVTLLVAVPSLVAVASFDSSVVVVTLKFGS